MKLPVPAQSGLNDCDPVTFDLRVRYPPGDPATASKIPVSRPEDPINEGNIPGFLYVALKSELALSTPAERPANMARFNKITTRSDAARYLSEVQPTLRVARTSRRTLARERQT